MMYAKGKNKLLLLLLLLLPNHRSKLYNDSFLVQSIKSYNNLNVDIKNLKTLYKFAATIKESAIMSYNK